MCARSKVEHIFYLNNNYGCLFNATTSIPPAANLPYLTDSSLVAQGEFVSYEQAHYSLQMTETLVKAVGLSKAKPNLQTGWSFWSFNTLKTKGIIFDRLAASKPRTGRHQSCMNFYLRKPHKVNSLGTAQHLNFLASHSTEMFTAISNDHLLIFCINIKVYSKLVSNFYMHFHLLLRFAPIIENSFITIFIHRFTGFTTTLNTLFI